MVMTVFQNEFGRQLGGREEHLDELRASLRACRNATAAMQPGDPVVY